MNRELHEQSLSTIHENPQTSDWDPSIKEHFDHCEVCQKTRAALRTMIRRLRGQELQIDAPPEVLERVRHAVEAASGAPPRRSPSPRRYSSAWLAAAALIAGVLIGVGVVPRFMTGPSSVDDAPVQTVAAYLADVNHDRYLLEASGRVLEHDTSDTSEAARWLSEGLGFDVALAEVPDGWQLDGTRVWHTLSRLSALARYSANGGESVIVFAVPTEGIHFGAAPIERDGQSYWSAEGWGYQGVAWVEGDLAWSAVGSSETTSMLDWAVRYRSGE